MIGWLAREKLLNGTGSYCLSIDRKPEAVLYENHPGYVEWNAEFEIDDVCFEKLTNKMCHLQPGDGPIKHNPS